MRYAHNQSPSLASVCSNKENNSANTHSSCSEAIIIFFQLSSSKTRTPGINYMYLDNNYGLVSLAPPLRSRKGGASETNYGPVAVTKHYRPDLIWSGGGPKLIVILKWSPPPPGQIMPWVARDRMRKRGIRQCVCVGVCVNSYSQTKYRYSNQSFYRSPQAQGPFSCTLVS